MLFLFFEQRELFILAKRVKDFKVSIKKHINIIIKTQANYPNYILPPELSKRMINSRDGGRLGLGGAMAPIFFFN